MKKIISLLLAACMLLALCGCGHEHTWNDATCTEPKTCSECGEIEGEALGHDWTDATCTEPKTCAVCGETEGEALGHDWTDATCTEPKTCAVCGATEGEALGHDWADATCTEPKTCAVCGATEGEALGHDWTDATCTAPKTCSRCGTSEGQTLEHIPTEADYWNPSVCSLCGIELAPAIEPDFVKYKFDTFCELGVSYDYRTTCSDGSTETVGKYTVISYETTKGNDRDLKEKDGYEWKIVKLVITFSDANAQKWDVYAVQLFDDYYDTRLMNDSCGKDIDGVYSWDIHWNGDITKCYLRTEGSGTWSNGVKTYNSTYYFQVPEGYDGVVIGAHKPRGLKVGESRNDYFFTSSDKDSLFFRLT